MKAHTIMSPLVWGVLGEVNWTRMTKTALGGSFITLDALQTFCCRD